MDIKVKPKQKQTDNNYKESYTPAPASGAFMRARLAIDSWLY